MRSIEVCRAEWHEHQEGVMRQAERVTRGNLIQPSMRSEFGRRFGMSHHGILRGLFLSAWPIRSRYASSELLEFWAQTPHVTFERWAWSAGYRRKFLREGLRRRGWAA